MVNLSTSGIVDLTFPNGCDAQALWLSPHQTSPQALEGLNLSQPRPTLVVIGGASLMSEESLQQLQAIFREVLAPLAQSLGTRPLR